MLPDLPATADTFTTDVAMLVAGHDGQQMASRFPPLALVGALLVARRAVEADGGVAADAFADGMAAGLEKMLAQRFDRGRAALFVDMVEVLIDDAIDRSEKATGGPFGGPDLAHPSDGDVEDAVGRASGRRRALVGVR